jgi:hypothetical protein
MSLRLAFACFFGALKGRLPPEAAALLPEDTAPAQLPPAAPPPPSAPLPAAPQGASDLRTEGALAMLALLQREGRLVDFLRQPLDGHDDAAIGAAVRDIHRGCKKVLDDHLRLEPVMPGSEDSAVMVPRGFDPSSIRIVGRVAGDPPFRGLLVHHGWRAVDVRFPSLSDGVDRRVLAPAEVRVS